MTDSIPSSSAVGIGFFGGNEARHHGRLVAQRADRALRGDRRRGLVRDEGRGASSRTLEWKIVAAEAVRLRSVIDEVGT